MAQPDADFQLRCQIIEEVKERPLLYNMGHPKYQINSCWTEEFAHISVAVGKTGEYSIDLHVICAFALLLNQDDPPFVLK